VVQIVSSPPDEIVKVRQGDTQLGAYRVTCWRGGKQLSGPGDVATSGLEAGAAACGRVQLPVKRRDRPDRVHVGGGEPARSHDGRRIGQPALNVRRDGANGEAGYHAQEFAVVDRASVVVRGRGGAGTAVAAGLLVEAETQQLSANVGVPTC